MSNSLEFIQKSGSNKNKKNFEAHFCHKYFLVLQVIQYMRKFSNSRERSCDTVLHAYQFFLWEFNMEKMYEKWSVMINQQQALKGDNEKFHKKRLKQQKRALIWYENR